MTPTSAEDWLDVGPDRAADADALLKEREDPGGPGVSCGLCDRVLPQAYLQSAGKSFPSSGGAGHDLRGLWQQSGFCLRDLGDDSGAKAFFVQDWSTALRYEAAPDFPCPSAELVDAAQQLCGSIRNKMRRQRQTRRARTRR
ncbi:hypothetical protein [uncultured Thiohalocapsa sp.]|uniref:hypothetical protein n=1 Tax=uncultured Thiohalocapsa sp. TaxID=768990 RepID=UPI0025EDA556|nr:hypothetical protein [uncultured Thiohalocapsa sp.]